MHLRNIHIYEMKKKTYIENKNIVYKKDINKNRQRRNKKCIN